MSLQPCSSMTEEVHLLTPERGSSESGGKLFFAVKLHTVMRQSALVCKCNAVRSRRQRSRGSWASESCPRRQLSQQFQQVFTAGQRNCDLQE